MEYVTAGESHGPALTAVVTGVPAGVPLRQETLDADMARRQAGYGRGGRQAIERDTVQVVSGVRFGATLGTPIALRVENRDWDNWHEVMSAFGARPARLAREVTPRPGHADLVGALKLGTDDCRDVLERASASETAARVAAGGVARAFLDCVGVEVASYVTSIGAERFDDASYLASFDAASHQAVEAIEASAVRCPDEEASARMCEAIDAARAQGESLGGTFRVVACGLMCGLGSFASGGERLTSRIGAALFGIPAIKGVEFGLGFDVAQLSGSAVHDPIALDGTGAFTRSSNNAGGLEGGMSTGLPLAVSAAMKPIPTLASPLATVNLDSLDPASASRERSDVCAVPACAVVAEAEVCLVLADAYTRTFGCTTMDDMKASVEAYRVRIAERTRTPKGL